MLQVQGPRALDVLAAIVDGAPPSPFDYFGVARCTIQQQPIIVSRTGWTGEMGFEIYTTPDVDGPALWHFILERGAPHELRFGGLDSMGIRRIEAGIYDNGTDSLLISRPMLPGWASSYTEQGKLIGRESLVTPIEPCDCEASHVVTRRRYAVTALLAAGARSAW